MELEGKAALFAVTRPRGMRILTTSFRPMSENPGGEADYGLKTISARIATTRAAEA